MKEFELKATEENIFSTLNSDVLEHRADIVYFIRLLNLIKGGRSVALDGQWGSGKTFFVKQVKLVLDAYNPFCEVDENKRDQIKNLFDQSFEIKDGYSEVEPMLTLYYDAWENDSSIDPLISLIYHIAIQTNQYKILDKTKTNDIIINSVAKIIDLVPLPLPSFIKPGKVIEHLKENFKVENPLNIKQTEQKLKEAIDAFFGTVIQERGNHLVVFIDELDRCRPDFAVKLLERVKHYFDNQNITFVFSMNSIELTETIKQFYGTNFDGGRYLNRFFDFCIPLPKGNMQRLLESYKLDKEPYYDINILLAAFDGNDLELREILKAIRTFSLIENNLHSMHRRMSWDAPKSLQFCYMTMVPILISVAVRNMQEYHKFIKGERVEIFLNIIKQLQQPQRNFAILLAADESYEDYEQTKQVKLDEKLTSFYNALFLPVNKMKDVEIGECNISSKVRQRIIDIASLLSNFSNFQ